MNGIYSVKAADLLVKYGEVTALTIPSLELSGQVIALIGHNGSGKSTFIKTLLGLLPKKRGELFAEHERAALIPEQHMAYSPETGAIFADILVEDYLQLWCRLKCGDPFFYKAAGSEIVDGLGVTELLGKFGRELSKGQKRRVQVAVGFLISPRLFVLDEPFDGLDIEQVTALIDTMKKRLEDSSLLISSHRMDIVERLADGVIMLHNGSVLASGTVTEVCKALGGEAYCFTLPTDFQQMSGQVMAHIEQLFPSALSYRIGNQIVVTGKQVGRDTLQALLKSVKLGIEDVQTLRPSLSDAVHAQLRSQV